PSVAVSRQLAALERGFGQEGEQDTGLADLKENVTAWLLADDRQAQNRLVEAFRRLEIIDVKGGFNNGLDLQGSLPSGRTFRPLTIQFGIVVPFRGRSMSSGHCILRPGLGARQRAAAEV